MLLKYVDLTQTHKNDIKNLNRNNVTKIKDLKQLGKINDKHLIFSPLLGRIYLLDDEAKKTFDNGFSDKFIEGGLLVNENSNFFPKPMKNNTNTVGIFLTTKCNLRCRYCYASGGESNRTISFDFVKAGIERIIKNHNKLQMEFHGGGEPTQEFDLLRKTVMWAKTKTDDLIFSVQTNGVFSNSILSWLMDNKAIIGLSVDGPPYIQDNQRPLVGNRKTSAIAEETIKRLVEANYGFGVQSTISAFSVGKQDEIIEYFYNLGVKRIRFEPLFSSERSLKDNTIYSKPPKLDLFVENFLKAVEFAKDCGIELASSFNSVEGPRCSFCGASGYNFSLTTDGYLTLCHLAPLGDSKIKDFIYGKFNKKTKNIEIFESKVDRLKNRIVQNMPDCQDCFLKWYCAGWCAARTFLFTGDMFKPLKKVCNARREITKRYFIYLARKMMLEEKPKIIHKKRIIYKNFFSQTVINEIKNDGEFKDSSYITIDLNRVGLKKLLHKIVQAKEKNGWKPVFFILNFNLREEDLNRKRGEELEEFLKELQKLKIHYKITTALPLCLFKHNTVVNELKIPVESNKPVLDNNAEYKQFRKCENCIYRIRRKCGLYL